jgi:small subunit ribosomal protein S9
MAMAIQQNYGTGRRKRSTARVFLRKGNGTITINGLPIDKYLDRETMRMHALEPLKILQMDKNFDLYITVKGGGKSGQAGAIRHGLARALVEYETVHKPDLGDLLNQLISRPETTEEEGESAVVREASIHTVMRQEGFLTRDDREVLRKRISFVKSRKRPQYSKR